ncbi:MAG: hypothetical protein MJ180_03660 [Candidatus Gastranaerophilales bacterium]|nr:hypothetical protein [Candidatus Gastranaerophilales bacterium]
MNINSVNLNSVNYKTNFKGTLLVKDLNSPDQVVEINTDDISVIDYGHDVFRNHTITNAAVTTKEKTILIGSFYTDFLNAYNAAKDNKKLKIYVPQYDDSNLATTISDKRGWRI